MVKPDLSCAYGTEEFVVNILALRKDFESFKKSVHDSYDGHVKEKKIIFLTTYEEVVKAIKEVEERDKTEWYFLLLKIIKDFIDYDINFKINMDEMGNLFEASKIMIKKFPHLSSEMKSTD